MIRECDFFCYDLNTEQQLAFDVHLVNVKTLVDIDNCVSTLSRFFYQSLSMTKSMYDTLSTYLFVHVRPIGFPLVKTKRKPDGRTQETQTL